MPLRIEPVEDARGRRRFVDLPFRLFGQDPTWVPPLRLSVLDRISPRHPALEHQETQLWMAWRDGRPVARLGACVDRMFNELQDLSWGWLGFFESTDDQEAADALFERGWAWAAGRGATVCVGPASFTTNDECGLQVEGFDHPPLILTPQNPPYYERLWTRAGWTPAMDLWGWHFDRLQAVLSDRQRAVLERLQTRSQLRVRQIRMDRFDEEVGRFFSLYNSAWARNWGFAPMTEAEVRHLAKDLKRIIDPEVALFVENAKGEAVAAALTLPDANEPMARVRSGRLLPIGWYHLLTGMRHVSRYRVFALGVRPDLQNLAIGPLLYGEIIRRLEAKPGVLEGEASWILASNDRMNTNIVAAGGKRYKTWRLFERQLAPAPTTASPST
ncbi:MAG: hypothetical protein ACRDYD_13730 [Acidimicrobiales bacterium]